MIVFVRYNLGPGVAVELQEEASVAELKELVGGQQGVRPDRLKVLFAGRELQNTATLQGCDLPEQSTVHVVLHPLDPSSGLLLLQTWLSRGREENQDGLTRLDLSSSRLPSTSSGLAVILKEIKGGDGGEEEEREEMQAAAIRGAHTCSTFFVYCKRCSSAQPGKLRVRCRNCKQTTLTLSRGPSCWDDVLFPGRIHGVCQSAGCHGNEAEFFMKCASHPTTDDDPSVALDLIVTNSRGVPCIACTDVSCVVLVFQCRDQHVICLDCFRRYCQTRLNERQFVHHPVIGYSLPCADHSKNPELDFTVNRTIADADSRNHWALSNPHVSPAVGCDDSLIKELHHFRLLGDDQYGRYLQYGAEECLRVIGGLMCPSPDCGTGLLPPDGSRKVECDRQVGCGFIFCRECREAYHEGGCQVTLAPPTDEVSRGFVVEEAASRQGRWDQASLLLIRDSTMPCPQCLVPVEKNGGCMHMQCPLCRAEWCWICRVAWNRDCMGNHWFG